MGCMTLEPPPNPQEQKHLIVDWLKEAMFCTLVEPKTIVIADEIAPAKRKRKKNKKKKAPSTFWTPPGILPRPQTNSILRNTVKTLSSMNNFRYAPSTLVPFAVLPDLSELPYFSRKHIVSLRYKKSKAISKVCKDLLNYGHIWPSTNMPSGIYVQYLTKRDTLEQ